MLKSPNNVSESEGSEIQEKLSGLDWWIHEIRELVVTIAVIFPFWMIITSFAYELRTIPSESMVPNLEVGDRVAVGKFAYGYSRNSLVFGIGRWFFSDDPADPDERLFASMPKRGDVVVFKHTFENKVMIKRLIGLPGDTIQLKAGVIWLNGAPIPRTKVRDVRYVPHGASFVQNAVEYRETMPDGTTYLIHDWPGVQALDDTPEFQVPEGHVFMMGDNRDNSEDSRAPSGHLEFARANPHAWGRPIRVSTTSPAIGYVPLDHLMGRGETVLFSLYRCHKAADSECAKPRLWRGLLKR